MVKKTTVPSERLSDLLVSRIRKKFNDESATTSGKESLSEIPDYISTQSFALDAAIGHPGIPVGRLTVIQGKEASGKTTIATQLGAECQKRGGVVVYLDAEDAFETEHAADLGLYDEDEMIARGITGVEPLILLYPENIMDAFQKIDFAIANLRELDPDRLLLVIWDSVAATPTTEEASDETYDAKQPGLAARQVSKGLRRLTKIVAKEKVAFVCINQVKEAIVVGFGGFGDKTATIASKPLGFHASIRLVTAHAGFAGGKKRSEAKGITTLVKVNKNKIAPPHREAEFDIMYANGIDNDGSMLKMAKAFKIVKTNGSFLTYNGGDNFRSKDFNKDLPDYSAIVSELTEAVTQRQQEAIGRWKAEASAVDIDDEDDEEYLPRPKKLAELEDEDD